MNDEERKLMIKIAAQVDRHEKEIAALTGKQKEQQPIPDSAPTTYAPVLDFSTLLRKYAIASLSITFKEYTEMTPSEKDTKMQHFIQAFLGLCDTYQVRSISITSSQPPSLPPNFFTPPDYEDR